MIGKRDEPMNRQQLEQTLKSEGCHFAIGHLGDDLYCLIQTDGIWQVVYAERGCIQEILFQSADEAAACEFMAQQVTQLQHLHLVGYFTTPAEAIALSATLTQLGLPHHTDQIPYRNAEPRFRVFVYDKAIFTAQQHFGELPLRSPG